MNLEQLRKQAKELARAARAGETAALARLDRREPTLAHAQLVIAREHGYASWPRLVAGAQAEPQAFVLAATNRQPTRAEAMLAARPEIADDPWARLVLGCGWDDDPSAPGGPRNWAPLVYVCHSCFPSAALARELLARGADPNASFHNEYGAMSALYGAAGVAHDPELTRVLLEAGANPDDGESLYHATEAGSTECLRLLLEHGASSRGTNALAHALDGDSLEAVRLLLEAGADPNEGALLAHAVRRGRGPEAVRLLAAHGADLDRAGGETWRGAVPLRTPYQHARLRGRDDTAATLAELGASTALDPADEAVEAIARGERPRVALSGTLDPDAQEVIVLAALRGHLDVVVAAVGPDFRGVVGGSPAGSLLHHAAWIGSPDLVRGLLEGGADPTGGAGSEAGTPLAWAAHGSPAYREPGRNYVAVAELLAEAGNEVEPTMLDEADGPLVAWLEERL
jgi:ankyrin repeat protein